MVMNLRRKGYLRQSTRPECIGWMKKESGQVNWTVGLFLILFAAVFLLAAMRAERFRSIALYMEDALAASNLASALVDLEEYGISHRILIAEPEEAYGKYCEALKENLNLNEEWKGIEGSVVAGPVAVENYIVYNMVEEGAQVYRFGPYGSVQEQILGTITAPNGVAVESTSVYSEISFTVEVVPGVTVQARRGNLVDVAADRVVAGN